MEPIQDDLFRTLQVMVVDDDPVFRRYLEVQLELLGCQIVPMENGETAWEWIQVQPPDLVLSDVFMPGMSGLELCRKIKSIPELATIPVVLLTMAGAKAKDEGYQAGADDFLNKPPHLVELRTRLRNLLLLRSLQAARELDPVGTPVWEPSAHAPRILVLESHGILREHVKNLLSQEGWDVQGVGAVDRFMVCLEDEWPDLLIIDQDLLEGPGSTLVARLRNQAPTADLTILLMCAPGELDGNGAWHSEADEILSKPFETYELRARVKALLRHSEFRRRRNAQHLDADPSALKDPRSGAYTRAYLYAFLEPMGAFAALAGRPIGLLAYQVSEMSPGHMGEVRRVAGVLKSHLKSHESLCRVGEGLFVAVLPGAGIAELVHRLELLTARLPSGNFATVVGNGEGTSALLKRLWEQLPA